MKKVRYSGVTINFKSVVDDDKLEFLMKTLKMIEFIDDIKIIPEKFFRKLVILHGDPDPLYDITMLNNFVTFSGVHGEKFTVHNSAIPQMIKHLQRCEDLLKKWERIEEEK